MGILDGKKQMATQSVAMAGAHLLLAAHAEGIATVWICAPLFAPKEVAQALDLPSSWLAQGIVYMGYSSKKNPGRSRKPLSDVLLSR